MGSEAMRSIARRSRRRGRTVNSMRFVATSFFILFTLHSADAEQRGGVLRAYHWANPATMSIHEEGGYSTAVTSMAIFNNLVLYKQDVPQNSLSPTVTDAPTDWSGNTDRTVLIFQLRSGVKWHDGMPF